MYHCHRSTVTTATARPCMEDVMSHAKILGYEHEKPPGQTRQAKKLTVWLVKHFLETLGLIP
eukprot:12278120-Ditylum_brightwellii.AAC.1